MDAVDRKRNIEAADAMDASGALSVERRRALVGSEENSGESVSNREKRCRAGDLHLAFVAGKQDANGARPTAEVFF